VFALVLASSVVGVIVISLVTVALTRFRNDFEMGAAEFHSRMVRLAGSGNLGPAALHRRLE
jgi:hypothetical protein